LNDDFPVEEPEEPEEPIDEEPENPDDDKPKDNDDDENKSTSPQKNSSGSLAVEQIIILFLAGVFYFLNNYRNSFHCY
jgi:hypothetical protein